jgi:hypothetical protein
VLFNGNNKLSFIVAKEQLLIAESKGLLCRDESPKGLYFFENYFSNW